MNLDALEDRNKNSAPKLRVRFDRADIERYARRHWKLHKKGQRWNGRQIKNAFQTAVALADWDNLKYSGDDGHSEGPLLETRHFDVVSKASDHFDMYLTKVRRKDDERAKEAEVRRDDITNDLDDEVGFERHKAKKRSGKVKHKIMQRSSVFSDTSSEEEERDGDSDSEDDSTSDGTEFEEDDPPPPRKSSKKKAAKKNKRGE